MSSCDNCGGEWYAGRRLYLDHLDRCPKCKRSKEQIMGDIKGTKEATLKNHVVKYPGSIKKALLTVEDMEKYRAFSIISKAGLPEGTLFDSLVAEDEDGFGHTIFTILLPSGEAFSGFAIKAAGAKHDNEAAACVAAGRAVAVWKAQKGVLPEEVQRIYDTLCKEQIYVAEALEAVVKKQIALDEAKAYGPSTMEDLFKRIKEGTLMFY